MKVLYVTHELPFPALAGHQLRYREIIDALPLGTRVHVIGFSEADCGLSRFSKNVSFEAVPAVLRIRKRPAVLAGAITKSLLRGIPYSIAKYPKDKMQKAIAQYCSKEKPNIIITSVFTWHMVPPGPSKIFVDAHNIEHDLWQSFVPHLPTASALFAKREARLLRNAERAAWYRSDGVIAICNEDAALIRKICPGAHVQHVPVRISPTNKARSHGDGHPLFDVGMLGVWSWAPNAYAIRNFEKSILPTLVEAGLRVTIAGRGLDPKVTALLQRRGVDCSGHVPDLERFYSSVRLVAAPYTIGGGVRMKVAEALSWGKPVIGTSLAFRGIVRAVPSDWITDNMSDMASAIIDFSKDPTNVPVCLAELHSIENQQMSLGTLITSNRR